MGVHAITIKYNVKQKNMQSKGKYIALARLMC